MLKNLNEIKKCENVTVRKVEEKYYLLRSGKCFRVNETGILIVKYIGKDMLLDEFCDKLVKKYGNEQMLDQVKQDVVRFIQFLSDNEMIENC